jgi:hypothetical protein
MCRKLIYLVSFVLVLGLAHNAFAEIPRDPNLVIYYSYEDVRAVVPDESGKGHNGTVCGDVSAYPSGIEWYGAAKFLGIWGPAGFSYLDLDSPHYPAADIPKAAITIAAWCKNVKTGQEHALMSFRAKDNTWVMHPQINDNGTFRWLLRANGGVNIVNINGVGSHGWDEWLYYAGTYDSATHKGVLYINGVNIASQDTVDPCYISDWGTGARVGYNIDNARPFTGLMDELYLFTRALSQAEIQVLMWADNGLPSEKASHPSPGNGIEIETTSTDLLWLPGAYAVSNNVYFGSDQTNVTNATTSNPLGVYKGNQTEAKFTVSGLVWGTTYYWRIDGVNTVNSNSPWKGNVWSFWLRPQTAWNPNPPDGARFIVPDANLSWSPGRDAATHDVYFGPNQINVTNATTSNPLGVYKGNQTLTTYDPGTLELEKVYYWRVDERIYATKYKGAVWSFTTHSRYAGGLTGQYYNDMTLTNLVLTRLDPGINFNWGAKSPDPLVNPDNFSVRWAGDLEAIFTEPYTFYVTVDDCPRLWVNNQLLLDKWGYQSGVEWSAEINLTAGQKYSIVMEYEEIGGNAYAYLSWKSPSQPKQIIPAGVLSPPLRARNPSPADGAVDVKHTPKLMWVAGERAVNHDVYFGTNQTKVANGTGDTFKGNQTLTTYDPGTLEFQKVYYWRIDEVNTADSQSPWKGSVWSFTTGNFVVVDDFENYTDTTPNNIWETWIDGWGVTIPPIPGNGTGSTVYLGTGADIHSGAQSMLMTYDNTTKLLYSETDRTWAAQDWNDLGVKSLTVWFKGIGTNTAEPLYVAVKDSAGTVKAVTHTDANAVRLDTWQEWNIPLKTFSDAGLSLNSITKMYIGVGNRDSPTAGGTGTIYIDDIRLYRPRCMANKPLGDFSNDCVVDYADLDVMVDEWLNTVPPEIALATDLNGDKKVDLKDYAVFAQHWLEVVALWP